MILVLEGACGTGKTTLANKLRAILEWPIYRAFRIDPTSHEPGKQDPRLAQLPNFPINTWREDLYTADVLAVTRPNLIMDRSLPSGLAYDSEVTTEQRHLAAELWAERMAVADARVVFLDIRPSVREQRAPNRGGQWEVTSLRDTFAHIVSQTDLPIHVVDTTAPLNSIANAVYQSHVMGTHHASLRRFRP